jgi:hypothetical protein
MEYSSAGSEQKCELCERPVAKLTVHHLVPVSQGRRAGQKSTALPTALLCGACHRHLHTVFSNRDLARELASLDKLKETLQIQRFLGWVRKQYPNKHIRVRR